MRSVYQNLLRLYPEQHRRQFGDEMLSVFRQAQRDSANDRLIARGLFYTREIGGLARGAVRENLHTMLGAHAGIRFRTRRFTMRDGFRFPKSTAVLMMIILAGIAVALEKARGIQASYSHGDPPLVPLEAAHFTFIPTIALITAIFYALGLIGWAILFALRRSGVHRLADLSGQPK